jgi:hypothetical protein
MFDPLPILFVFQSHVRISFSKGFCGVGSEILRFAHGRGGMRREIGSDLEVKLTYGHIELLQDLLKGFGRISYRKHDEDLATGKEEIPIEETV